MPVVPSVRVHRATISKASFLAGVLVVALLGVTISPQEGTAQAALHGRVVDSEMGTPVAGATVRIRRGPLLTTDSLGRFEAGQLPAGEADVTVQAFGYGRADFKVFLPDSETVVQTFGLDFTGHDLPEIEVRGRAERLMPRYADFEQRRQRGLGAYLRWDDLIKKGSGSVSDALRSVRGVRIQCDQASYECFAVMARSPQCHPAWWIDGVEVHSFHENTPVRDVYGIEIYRGPGEVPGEFAGSNAACGVIVMWTKSRPYR